MPAKFNPGFILFLMLFPIATLGCGNDDAVKTYRIAKDRGASPALPQDSQGMPELPLQNPPAQGDNGSMQALPGMETPDSARREIRWKLPPGWTEQPASQMRVGSFIVKGKSGMNSDVSIIPLSGQAGNDLGNINRWRGQINLEPISEAELPKVLKTIQSGGRQISFVNFASRQPLIRQKYKKRLMAAYFADGERTWFIKMTGEDSDVVAAKPSFLRFLSSLQLSHE
jgi:hypothetical protein